MADTIGRALAVFRELATDIKQAPTDDDALRALTEHCVNIIDNAEDAGITCVSDDGFETAAPTGKLAEQVDALQFELRSGPCLDAAIEDKVFRTNDLRIDERWPEFGRRASEELGVLSMLSFRLFFEDDDNLSAALNVYSRKTDAFTPEAQMSGLAASAYGAAVVTSKRQQGRILNLERALASNREIGAAIGVLMAQYKVTQDQGFDLLRMASQNTHRKLADVARDVVETGALRLD
jgi:hypothetical protein